jgi:hypothetical protein
VGTSLSGAPIVVAHTGMAHLGLAVDRGLLRALASARAFSEKEASRFPLTAGSEPAADVEAEAPAEIYFRRATTYSVVVSDGQVHLILHATGQRGRQDVHVELLVSDQLLGRLGQVQNARHRHPRRPGVIKALLETASTSSTRLRRSP